MEPAFKDTMTIAASISTFALRFTEIGAGQSLVVEETGVPTSRLFAPWVEVWAFFDIVDFTDVRARVNLQKKVVYVRDEAR